MVHYHTVHLPLGALLSPCTMCGTGSEERAGGGLIRSEEGLAWTFIVLVSLIGMTLGASKARAVPPSTFLVPS